MVTMGIGHLLNLYNPIQSNPIFQFQPIGLIHKGLTVSQSHSLTLLKLDVFNCLWQWQGAKCQHSESRLHHFHATVIVTVTTQSFCQAFQPFFPVKMFNHFDWNQVSQLQSNFVCHSHAMSPLCFCNLLCEGPQLVGRSSQLSSLCWARPGTWWRTRWTRWLHQMIAQNPVRRNCSNCVPNCWTWLLSRFLPALLHCKMSIHEIDSAWRVLLIGEGQK